MDIGGVVYVGGVGVGFSDAACADAGSVRTGSPPATLGVGNVGVVMALLVLGFVAWWRGGFFTRPSFSLRTVYHTLP